MQGTSRGGADVHKIVQVLERWNSEKLVSGMQCIQFLPFNLSFWRFVLRWDIKMLFVVGGNGGNAAAQAIQVGLGLLYTLRPLKLRQHEALLTPVCCRTSASGGTSLPRLWECQNPSTTIYYS